jgi:Xaa-Pro aminopeptidase
MTGICIVAILLAGAPVHADEPEQGRTIDSLPEIQPWRQRAETVNRILADRLDNLLPRLMREAGIDMWLVIAREYAEDPVYLTLVPEPVFAARRTSMLIFHDRGPEEGVERLTVSRYTFDDLYEAAWEGGDLDEQWLQLGALIAERDPEKIAIDTSPHWAVADGLTAGLEKRLMTVLSSSLHERVVSAQDLVIRWLETRTPLELEIYPQIVALARRVIAEAFSSRVITPGATTTDDVGWYIRQRFEQLELPPWFQPYVNFQRRGIGHQRDEPFFGEAEGVIQRGDVLHTDVGICYLRLCTDTQEMGYVLRLGEDDVPDGLRKAMAIGNRWQDLLTAEFRTGRTGNEILAAATAAVERAGIVASIYTHPLGFFGHGPGPAIGMWDNHGQYPIFGDRKVRPSTAYAIEGNIKAQVPEWDDEWVQIKLEQSAIFDGSRVIYLAGRQTRWHVIR